MLTNEEIQKYKERLEQTKKKLLQEIETDRKREDFGSDVDSFDEETDEAEEFSTQLGIEKVLKERINHIDMALNRITMGAYGKCEKCGTEISKKVLNAVPESSFCEKCKKSK